jgi:ABC-type transporter MlaC component
MIMTVLTVKLMKIGPVWEPVLEGVALAQGAQLGVLYEVPNVYFTVLNEQAKLLVHKPIKHVLWSMTRHASDGNSDQCVHTRTDSYVSLCSYRCICNLLCFSVSLSVCPRTDVMWCIHAVAMYTIYAGSERPQTATPQRRREQQLQYSRSHSPARTTASTAAAPAATAASKAPNTAAAAVAQAAQQARAEQSQRTAAQHKRAAAARSAEHSADVRSRIEAAASVAGEEYRGSYSGQAFQKPFEKPLEQPLGKTLKGLLSRMHPAKKKLYNQSALANNPILMNTRYPPQPAQPVHVSIDTDHSTSTSIVCRWSIHRLHAVQCTLQCCTLSSHVIYLQRYWSAYSCSVFIVSYSAL